MPHFFIVSHLNQESRKKRLFLWASQERGISLIAWEIRKYGALQSVLGLGVRKGGESWQTKGTRGRISSRLRTANGNGGLLLGEEQLFTDTLGLMLEKLSPLRDRCNFNLF